MKDIDYELGTEFARTGDYRKAIDHLLRSAERLNFDAINDLGVIYERKKKYKDAYTYYVMAATGGRKTALFNLGNAYENGYGTDVDKNAALIYYRLSAEKGYALAYKKIAKFYTYGLGVEKDLKKALEYIKKGIKIEKKGKFEDTDCLDILAYHYENGLGVKKNYKKALKLWRLSAKHGNYYSTLCIAYSYLNGEGVKKNVQLAVTILIRLLAKEYKPAYYTLFTAYEKDEYGIKDLKQAGKILIDGADKGNENCLLRLAELCLEGKEKEYDLNPIKQCTEKALVHFWSIVKGKEEEYKDEIEQYNKIKEKFKDEIDWESVENLKVPDEDEYEFEDC